MSDYRWVELDAEEYEAAEVWGMVVAVRPEFVVLRPQRERGPDAPWELRAVLHLDTDGFAGLEHIDDYSTLGAAKEAAEAALREISSSPA